MQLKKKTKNPPPPFACLRNVKELCHDGFAQELFLFQLSQTASIKGLFVIWKVTFQKLNHIL